MNNPSNCTCNICGKPAFTLTGMSIECANLECRNFDIKFADTNMRDVEDKKEISMGVDPYIDVFKDRLPIHCSGIITEQKLDVDFIYSDEDIKNLNADICAGLGIPEKLMNSMDSILIPEKNPNLLMNTNPCFEKAIDCHFYDEDIMEQNYSRKNSHGEKETWSDIVKRAYDDFHKKNTEPSKDCDTNKAILGTDAKVKEDQYIELGTMSDALRRSAIITPYEPEIGDHVAYLGKPNMLLGTINSFECHSGILCAMVCMDSTNMHAVDLQQLVVFEYPEED